MEFLIEVPAHIRGLIFDCDGTLVDSMALHMEAWRHAMQHCSALYDHEFFYSKKGMKETDIIRLYNARFRTALNAEEVVEVKHRYFSERIHTVKPFEPVVEVVRRYRGALPMAVVSGSVRQIVSGELKAIGIVDAFRTILTADDPFRQKPAPDMFLEAARLLEVRPSLCQVFEDGDLGLRAAREAGMVATDVRPFTETE